MQINAHLSYAKMEEHVTLKMGKLSAFVLLNTLVTLAKEVSVIFKFFKIYFPSEIIKVHSGC